ncbi:MAG TPA: glycosyltransferase [Ramlibacter sp.]|nr:glycosyltransferase [Ramlibacter sp.]
MAAVRVFVACTAAERLPMRVLEFSLRENTRHQVEVAAIGDFGRSMPQPADRRNRPRTPFSFQRFLIPELCGFQGRAIYLDADMQVFGDIDEVWSHAMAGHDLVTVTEGNSGRRGQFSVMLLDCARLPWRIEDIVGGLDAGRYGYEQLMQEMCVAPHVGRTLAPAWNSLEHHEPGVTRLLHYTDMDTQPWVSRANPLGHLWVACLRRAVEAGAIPAEDVQQAVGLGHVRPSLWAELQDPAKDRAALAALDRGFKAPYRSIRSGSASPYTSWRAAVRAWGRRGLQRLRSLSGG